MPRKRGGQLPRKPYPGASSSYDAYEKEQPREMAPNASFADAAKTVTDEAMRAILTASTHYEALSVSPTASTDEIKSAYRKLALRYHPDKNASPGANDVFKRLAQASAVLGDQGMRESYDVSLTRPTTVSGADAFVFKERDFEVDPDEEAFFLENFFTTYCGHGEALDASQLLEQKLLSPVVREMFRDYAEEIYLSQKRAKKIKWVAITVFIVILVLSLWSAAGSLRLRSAPRFHLILDNPDGFKASRTTKDTHVPYFIAEKLSLELDSNIIQRNLLEKDVNKEYKRLQRNCAGERQAREAAMTLAKRHHDAVAMADAVALATHSCTRFTPTTTKKTKHKKKGGGT